MEVRKKQLFEISRIALKRKIETKDSLTNGLHATLQKRPNCYYLNKRNIQKNSKRSIFSPEISFLTANRRNIEATQPNIISILIFCNENVHAGKAIDGW